MILVTYTLMACSLTAVDASVAVQPRPHVPQRVYVQVVGDFTSTNPYGVLGPGDLITGGRVIASGPNPRASTESLVPLLSSGDLGTLGLTLLAKGAPPASSTESRTTLDPGDLVTGGTKAAARRR
jgi:hypothetical protein